MFRTTWTAFKDAHKQRMQILKWAGMLLCWISPSPLSSSVVVYSARISGNLSGSRTAWVSWNSRGNLDPHLLNANRRHRFSKAQSSICDLTPFQAPCMRAGTWVLAWKKQNGEYVNTCVRHSLCVLRSICAKKQVLFSYKKSFEGQFWPQLWVLVNPLMPYVANLQRTTKSRTTLEWKPLKIIYW